MQGVHRRIRLRSAKKILKPISMVVLLISVFAANMISSSTGVFAATTNNQFSYQDSKRQTACMAFEAQIKSSMVKSQSYVTSANRSWQSYEKKAKSIVTGQDKIDAQRLFKVAMKGSIEALKSYSRTMRLGSTQPRCWKSETFDAITVAMVMYESLITQMELFQQSGVSDLLAWSDTNDPSVGSFLNPKSFGVDPMILFLKQGFIRNN